MATDQDSRYRRSPRFSRRHRGKRSRIAQRGGCATTAVSRRRICRAKRAGDRNHRRFHRRLRSEKCRLPSQSSAHELPLSIRLASCWPEANYRRPASLARSSGLPRAHRRQRLSAAPCAPRRNSPRSPTALPDTTWISTSPISPARPSPASSPPFCRSRRRAAQHPQTHWPRSSSPPKSPDALHAQRRWRCARQAGIRPAPSA